MKLGAAMGVTAFLRHLVLMSLCILACSVPAICGEIHDASIKVDLAKVKAMLKDNPNLVASKSNNGWTPLRCAAQSGHKDVVEFLLANKAEIDANGTSGLILCTMP
jgi:ankyrin repeat protein